MLLRASRFRNDCEVYGKTTRQLETSSAAGHQFLDACRVEDRAPLGVAAILGGHRVQLLEKRRHRKALVWETKTKGKKEVVTCINTASNQN